MDMLFKILLMMGSREIGRKNGTLSLAEHLGIGIMLESFQSAGRHPDAIDRLKIEAIDGAISSAKLVNIHAVIPSGPGAE